MAAAKSLLNLSDVTFEYTKGKGPGGQHRNKTSSTVKATHTPTGIVVVANGRCQHTNKRHAIEELQERLVALADEKRGAARKERRDIAIHERNIIRTYNYDRGLVKDHRSGKTASIKDVLEKGRIDLLRASE
jgi:protein subunit release factor A